MKSEETRVDVGTDFDSNEAFVNSLLCDVMESSHRYRRVSRVAYRRCEVDIRLVSTATKIAITREG